MMVLRYLKAFKGHGSGVLERWSIGVLIKKDINPSPITPTLHYSNTPKLVVIERTIDFNNVSCSHQRSFLGVRNGNAKLLG
jgi:hypothetical protein